VNVCTSYLTVVSFLVIILRLTVQGFDGSSFNYAFMQYSVNKYSKLSIEDSIISVFDNYVHGFELYLVNLMLYIFTFSQINHTACGLGSKALVSLLMCFAHCSFCAPLGSNGSLARHLGLAHNCTER
jgi:hypothetical protein